MLRAALFLALCASAARAVDRSKFHTCQQTAFCKAHRGQAPPHALSLANVALGADDKLHAQVAGAEGPLDLQITFYDNGVARAHVNEHDRPRWEYDDSLVEVEQLSPVRPSQEGNVFSWAGSQLTVEHDPLALTLSVGGAPAVVMTDLHFDLAHEHADQSALKAQLKAEEEDKHKGKTIVDYGEDGRAIYSDGSVEEATADEAQHEVTMGDDAETLAARLSFPGAQQLYGLPEHASSMALKTTIGEGAEYDEPFRLYNLDVFEYELDNPMALYGAMPVVWGQSTAGTHAALWLNPSETWVDVERRAASGDMSTHWMSEAGVVDLFLFPGPTPADVFRQYAEVTGFPALPPLFAIAYHQCRWNYRDEADVSEVNRQFEEHNIPMDVMWLDIEMTDGKRYFTWDKHLFPTPERMQEELAAHGRKMVTIVDPHMKRDNGYWIHKDASAQGLYVKEGGGSGKDFDGWCWPGSSSWIDFTAAHARDWWSAQFAYDKYAGSTPSLFTWNDMNEPSVFTGPEVTFPKDVTNLAGVEQREWHQLYGREQQRATAAGLVRRNEGENMRPFVLSRAFFPGTQKYGAIWTGDNTADWGHLKISMPMLLSIGIGGLGFAGADVGGFFGDPDAELLTRWYQVGAFQPFFRGHAHHDSKRREPYVFGEPHTARLRSAIMQRYANLPLFYTLYEEASRTGLPIMRPLFVEFPADERTYALDDEFMVGSALLVKPVTDAGADSVDVYLPPAAGGWFDFASHARVPVPAGGDLAAFPAPIDVLPVFQRAGTIVPQQRRLRRSSQLMHADPYTLVVALDAQGEAYGDLYVDDFESFDFTRGQFAHRAFSFADGRLRCLAARPASDYVVENTVERVIVAGLAAPPQSVTLAGEHLTFTVDEATGAVTIRKPGARVGEDWELVMSF